MSVTDTVACIQIRRRESRESIHQSPPHSNAKGALTSLPTRPWLQRFDDQRGRIPKPSRTAPATVNVCPSASACMFATLLYPLALGLIRKYKPTHSAITPSPMHAPAEPLLSLGFASVRSVATVSSDSLAKHFGQFGLRWLDGIAAPQVPH